MTPSDIIRAWKDPRYRAGLPATQLAQLPAHPAGAIELPEPTLHAAWPYQGFRVKSGLRAGAPTANCTGTNNLQRLANPEDDLPYQ